MSSQWFKFYGGEFLSDPKMLQLNGNERSCWVTLMALASQTKDGVIRFLSEAQLLGLSGVTEPISVLKKFEDLNMITICNGNVTVVNWDKRQYSESINRVREYRLKQKCNDESNGSETTERIERIERKNRKKELPDWLDKKIWEEWEEYRKSIKKKLNDLTISKQISFLEKQKLDHVAILEKSIQNGWVGLFPLDKKKPYSQSPPTVKFIPPRQKSAEEVKSISELLQARKPDFLKHDKT